MISVAVPWKEMRRITVASLVAGTRVRSFRRRLTAVFRDNLDTVWSFRVDDSIDDTCWFRGDGWWLSTAIREDGPSEIVV
jgi:hypothetical protein